MCPIHYINVCVQQEAKKLPAAKKSLQPPKNKAPPTVTTMNTATDVVIVKRSKVRETPKPKKFSRLKKLILIERAEKWKSRTNTSPTLQESIEKAVKNDETKENESEDEDIDVLSDEVQELPLCIPKLKQLIS